MSAYAAAKWTLKPFIALSYGFYVLVYRPVSPTRVSFVIKVSKRGDVKHGALGKTQDEPYAPDFLPGEWYVICPQIREQRKRMRSVC